MSENTPSDDSSTPGQSPTSVPSVAVQDEILSALRYFRNFASRQEKINDRVLALIGLDATDEDDATSASAVEEEKERPPSADEEKSRRAAVRASRKSVVVSNSNNSTLYAGDNLLSPTTPPPRVQTEAEKKRRESRLFNTPASASKTPAAPFAHSRLSLPSDSIDKSRHSKYYEANQAMKSIEKFYGDRKNDKDIDVYMFIRGVDFQLDRFMQGEVFRRLELVTSCTAGAAQMWLLNKRDDLSVLLHRGEITREMTEWEYVRADFAESMGGGQTQRLYQAKLDGLKLGRGSEGEELTKFITKFSDWALRAYPLDKHPDTKSRSLMLGGKFEARVRDKTAILEYGLTWHELSLDRRCWRIWRRRSLRRGRWSRLSGRLDLEACPTTARAKSAERGGGRRDGR